MALREPEPIVQYGKLSVEPCGYTYVGAIHKQYIRDR